MHKENKYILALDQGTTSSRAIIFDHAGEVIAVAQKPFEQIFPKPGWVEHDPSEIWYTQSSVAAEAVAKADLTGENIAAIGITNQRETVVIWDRETGMPVYNAIVWQDRRTAQYCDELKATGKTEMIRQKTGLLIDPYFSATKVKWILDNVAGLRERAEKGGLCFGTVDSWLVWKFTKGRVHITDITNASRTLLFNIHTQEWDQELLSLFDIPASILPAVRESSEIYTETATTLFATRIPIAGIAGDQQAALFGQMCIEEGMAKNTYGTGCFMLMNTGDTPVLSRNHLLTTVAWKINGKTTYALEGSIFVGGAAVQWLRDGLGIIGTAAESEQMALSVPDTDGVYFVPALTGLGAPYWDPYARGAILGITRGTTAAHIARATLEGIAFQVHDLLQCMESDMGKKSIELRVDGGAVTNDHLMQFQADIFGSDVVRPKVLETTALGAAYLAGLAVGYWSDTEELKKQWSVDKKFTPGMEAASAKTKLDGWKKAIERTLNWSQA